MNEIILWGIDKLVTLAPTLLLRLFYSPTSLAAQVKIELRGEKPINPSLGSSVPHLDVYFEITNLGNLDLNLERMRLELWFGQPLLNGAMLERISIPARSSTSEAVFRTDLTSRQITQIEPYVQGSSESGVISLSVHAYFESKVGLVRVEKRFERSRV